MALRFLALVACAAMAASAQEDNDVVTIVREEELQAPQKACVKTSWAPHLTKATYSWTIDAPADYLEFEKFGSAHLSAVVSINMTDFPAEIFLVSMKDLMFNDYLNIFGVFKPRTAQDYQKLFGFRVGVVVGSETYFHPYHSIDALDSILQHAHHGLAMMLQKHHHHFRPHHHHHQAHLQGPQVHSVFEHRQKRSLFGSFGWTSSNSAPEAKPSNNGAFVRPTYPAPAHVPAQPLHPHHIHPLLSGMKLMGIGGLQGVPMAQIVEMAKKSYAAGVPVSGVTYVIEFAALDMGSLKADNVNCKVYDFNTIIKA